MRKTLHACGRFSQRLLMAALVMGFMVAGMTQAASANEAEDMKEAELILNNALQTWKNFTEDPANSGFRAHVKEVKGVLIIPKLLKGAFLFGLEAGNGVLFIRDEKTDTWSEPAFYETTTVGFGLQAGVESSEAVLLVQTVKGVESLLSNSFKIGGDVSAALGTQGSGMEGSTSANLGKDFVTYSRTNGLFAGVSFEGASIRTRDDLNKSYYGSAVRPSDIVLVRGIKPNPRSQALRDEVVKLAGGK